MKNHLGKLTLILLFPILLFADAKLADYTLHVSKKELFVKEATVISFEAKQIDHTNAMFFFFEPKKSDAYEVILLDQNIKKKSAHDSLASFHYLLFPLKSGEIKIDFDFTIKVANDNALAEVYTGGKDNVLWMNTKNTKIKIEPRSLHVSTLEQKVDLVGDFTLDAKLQKKQINQYGAANILYTLQGKGYDEKNLQPLGAIKGVSSFSQISTPLHQASSEGYEIKREFAYALSSGNSFTIASKELKAYSPMKKKYYTLKTPDYQVKVTAIDPATLLDKKELPQNRSFQIGDLKEFFIGAVLFLAGFLTAKLFPKLRLKLKKEESFVDIKKTTSAKELILVLMQNYQAHEIKEFIDALEMLEYKNSSENFKEIKAKVLQKLM